jgi:hypothetical protein
MSSFLPIRSVKGLVVLFLLLFAQLSTAQVIVAGQMLGKSKWNERGRINSAQYKVEEGFATPYKRGPVLRLEGSLPGKIHGTAEFFYDKDDTLVAARVFSKNPDSLLKTLAKSSKAKREANNVFAVRDLRLRVEANGGQRFIQISSRAFDADFSSLDPVDVSAGTNWLTYAPWAIACLPALLAVAVTAAFHRKLWERREPVADYLVGLLAASVNLYRVLHLAPEIWRGFGSVVLGVHLIGYALIVAWALRTVRLSGWLPRKPLVELLWSVPLTPVLLLPVIVRNAVKSFHYAGLVVLFMQLFGLAYYYFHPGLWMSLGLLPVAGLLGAGVVRLYCATFGFFAKRDYDAATAAALAVFLWPAALTVGVLMFGFGAIRGFFVSVLQLLIPAIILGVLGSAFDLWWLEAIGFALPFLGILPGAAGFLAAGTIPTGYSNLDFGAADFSPATGLPMIGAFDTAGNAFGFGGIDFNPANGMPMIGGIGGLDSFGNPFGSNMNDPW